MKDFEGDILGSRNFWTRVISLNTPCLDAVLASYPHAQHLPRFPVSANKELASEAYLARI